MIPQKCSWELSSSLPLNGPLKMLDAVLNSLDCFPGANRPTKRGGQVPLKVIKRGMFNAWPFLSSHYRIRSRGCLNWGHGDCAALRITWSAKKKVFSCCLVPFKNV